MDEDNLFDGKTIPLQVLASLPTGRPCMVSAVTDNDGDLREAIIWAFIDEGRIRKAAFCIENGDYLMEM